MSSKKIDKKIDKKVAAKVLCTVDAGLCHGVGNPIPGQMCVMAAINYALNEPHGDQPKCVHPYMRDFDIHLNDLSWSSNKARAKGLRREAIAKLGSRKVNIKNFIRYMVVSIVFEMIPVVLRSKKKNKNAQRFAKLLDSYDTWEYDDAVFLANLLIGLGVLDVGALEDLSDTIDYENLASWAEVLYQGYEGKRKNAGDFFLTMMANAAADAMVECGSEGAKYLYLCDTTKKELRKLL